MRREGGGMGSRGFCVCVKCGYKKPHTPGVPCQDERGSLSNMVDRIDLRYDEKGNTEIFC